MLSGCGNKTISNEKISIQQYKGLEVTAPTDEDDELAVSTFESEIWQALLSNCTVEAYPQAELEQRIDELELQYSYVSYSEDKQPAELIEEIHGMTVEELAKEQLMKKYAVELIADEEGLAFTSEEYEKELLEQAKTSGISSTEYEALYGYEKLYQKFLEERVMELLKNSLK